MNLEVHVIAHDGEEFLPYALRHWKALGARTVIHDGGPTGKWRAMIENFGAEWRFFDSGSQLNDSLAKDLKNSCWRGTDADWVICTDADELLWFPLGAAETLAIYERLGAAVIKPHGFEMFSDVWFDPETNPNQITELIPFGAPDDEWYAKPVLFSPKRVCDPGFGIGAHESRAVLFDGRVLTVNRAFPKADPPCQLLHYHQIGSLERVAERYDATRKRLCAQNVAQNWGNVFDSGLVHAQKKRARILPNLRRVIA